VGEVTSPGPIEPDDRQQFPQPPGRNPCAVQDDGVAVVNPFEVSYERTHASPEDNVARSWLVHVRNAHCNKEATQRNRNPARVSGFICRNEIDFARRAAELMRNQGSDVNLAPPPAFENLRVRARNDTFC